MKNTIVIFCIVFVSFFMFNNCYSGDIYESSPIDIISFSKYIDIDYSDDGSIISRNITVEIINKSDFMLENFEAFIDSSPDYVNVSNDILKYGNIDPKSVKISNDSVIINIDKEYLHEDNIVFIWQIKFKIDGIEYIDETKVIEDI